MNFAELKTKEIVRMSDGKKLGFAEDVVIDENTNQVVALRVPKQTRGFRKPEYIEISFSNIVKIGENVILVEDVDCSVGKTQGNTPDVQKGEFFYSPKIFRRSDAKKK